jgi:hypothetical protein
MHQEKLPGLTGSFLHIIEMMHKEPGKLALGDPDMFDFIYAVLRS